MVFFLSLIIFLAIEVTPGDAASFMADPDMGPGDYEKMKEALGLNKPVWVRYGLWLAELFKGNLGYSMVDGTPVRTMIARRLPATLELMAAGFLISTFLGIVLGTIGALHQYSLTDHTFTLFGMLGISVPNFFVGILAIYILSLKLGLFPIGGRLSPFDSGVLTRLHHLILPALIIGLALTAGLMRYTRSTMLDVLNKDYMTTARSKGLPEWRVNLLHGFRTALTPVLLLLIFRLPMMIGGSVIIETVFSWPGMGRLFVTAISARDYPVIMIVALMVSLVFLFASLLFDIATAVLDPRVRYD
jgi:peptide/nickel transport system permease protein